MGVTIIKGGEVTRPDTEPLPSSILDHATVETVDDFGLRNDTGLWPSYNCLDLLVPTPICADPLVDNYKTFRTASWQPSFTFALQGGVQCRAVGLDLADQKAEVDRVFALSEGKGIEMALLANRFVASSGTDMHGQPRSWAAPTDLNPATPVPLPVALALLEGYAAATYVGVPTIHMSRAAASLLGADKIVWDGDKAYTRSGSKVAMGGGYDDATPPMTGLWTMFATGEVYVERSTEVSIQSQVLPSDGTHAGGSGLSDNDVIALAERMFRVAVDCFVAKATGTVWS